MLRDKVSVKFILEGLRVLRQNGYTDTCLNVLLETGIFSEFISSNNFHVISLFGEASRETRFVLNIDNFDVLNIAASELLSFSCSILRANADVFVLLDNEDWALVTEKTMNDEYKKAPSAILETKLVKYTFVFSLGRNYDLLSIFYRTYRSVQSNKFAQNIYFEYKNVNFVWQTVALECTKTQNRQRRSSLCVQMLRHLDDIIRYGFQDRNDFTHESDDLLCMIDFKSLYLIVRQTKISSINACMLRNANQDSKCLHDELEVLGCMYQLILTVMVITRSWDTNRLIKFLDRMFMEGPGESSNKSSIDNFFDTFKDQLDCSLTASLTSLLIDILGMTCASRGSTLKGVWYVLYSFL